MEIVAHRGNARDFPENTLPAFQSALDLGVRFVELDVQLSSDRVPVVLHDATLVRTTGQRGSAHDMTAEALARVPAGEPDRFGRRFADVTIPRLADVCPLIAARPGATLFVEIKEESIERFGLEDTVAAVLQAIAPIRDRSVVISFHREAVARARALGHPTVGWVLSDYTPATRRALERLAPDYAFVNHRRLSGSAPLWSGRWRWVVYDVTTLALARRLAARGVDLIETMAVEDMRQAIGGIRSSS
jgi:glycerophosphoryl diester phosphodiesterase